MKGKIACCLLSTHYIHTYLYLYLQYLQLQSISVANKRLTVGLTPSPTVHSQSYVHSLAVHRKWNLLSNLGKCFLFHSKAPKIDRVPSQIEKGHLCHLTIFQGLQTQPVVREVWDVCTTPNYRTQLHTVLQDAAETAPSTWGKGRYIWVLTQQEHYL